MDILYSMLCSKYQLCFTKQLLFTIRIGKIKQKSHERHYSKVRVQQKHSKNNYLRPQMLRRSQILSSPPATRHRANSDLCTMLESQKYTVQFTQDCSLLTPITVRHWCLFLQRCTYTSPTRRIQMVSLPQSLPSNYKHII